MPRGFLSVARLDDDTQRGRLYNTHVIQAATAHIEAHESTPATVRSPRQGIIAVMVAILIAAVAIPLLNGIGLERYRTGPFQFQAPAAWSVREARAAWSMGSSHAVIGTVPIPSRCGSGNVDINCYSVLKPPPSSVSIVLMTSSPLLPIADLDRYLDEVRSKGSLTDVAGLEAHRFEHAIAPNDYYRSDLSVSWVVPQPELPGTFWIIDARVRGPGAEALMRDVLRFVASMSIAQ
jgi:hypothetical protein